MLKHRVIPLLLVYNGGLVKTVRFSSPKYIGDPINAVRIFNEKEVDELIVLDISASKEGREPDFELIEQLAGECFMPLCYGGGIQTIQQARQIFALGVEKIALQSSVIEDITLIRKIADTFGSSSVVVSVDIKRNWLGKKNLYASKTGKILSLRWQNYIEQMITAGAGEIIINAVDRDGMMEGMDYDLIHEASTSLSVPLIAVGGVGSLSDIKAAFDAGASAVAAGSFFVFHGPHRAVLITYPSYQELVDILKEP